MKKYKYRKQFKYKGKMYSVYADDPVELGRKYGEKLRQLENDPQIIDEHTTLTIWAERCISAYKMNMAETTRKKFRLHVRATILKYIGDHRLIDITPMDIQDTLNQQAGKSKSQINTTYQALKFLFRHALDNHLIKEDPTAGLVRPSGTKGSRRALTAHEREMVLKVARTDRRYYAYLLMLECGCRPSEAFECMGRDIVLIDDYYMLHIRGTKTALADRYVPIPEDLLDLIIDTPKFEYISQNKAHNKITNQKLLWHWFSRQLNLAMGCKTYRNRLIPPYPLAMDLVPYCFRHEFCTNLARQGIDIRIAQKLMGHASIKTTGNIYTHVDNSLLMTAASLLGSKKDSISEKSHDGQGESTG